MKTDKIEIDGKTLYHIQAITGWSDSPYDIFTLSDHYPTKDEIRELFFEDRFGDGERYSKTEVDDFVNNSETYTVWAYEKEGVIDD